MQAKNADDNDKDLNQVCTIIDHFNTFDMFYCRIPPLNLLLVPVLNHQNYHLVYLHMEKNFVLLVIHVIWVVLQHV